MKRTSKKNVKTQKNKTVNITPENKSEKSSFIRKNLKYFFLALILFYIGTHLYNVLSEKEIFQNLQDILFIPTLLIGMAALLFDKNKLSETVNKLFDDTENSEKQNLIQKTKQLFSEKEILSTAIFIIILGISVSALFYKLDYFDIFSDEVQVTKGAAGYYHTGEYRQWDFIKKELVGKQYNRAKPHQYIVAQSYKLFGVNTWAARFPSALFGAIFMFLFYFIGRYFIKDKQAVLLTVLSFSLYFEFLFLGRWARMYAMVFPMFLIAFYWTFKFITETSNKSFFNFEKHSVFKTYFNFNYIYLPFILILVYLNLFTHPNTTILFPIYLVFLFFSVLLFRNKKKYLTAFIFASLLLIIQLLFPYKINFHQFTFFDINNSEIYNKALFGYPFSTEINFIFLSLGFVSLFIFKNNHFRKKYLILFSTTLLTWILFSYIIDYAPSYRYVSFVTPLIILLIIGSFVLINRILYNKFLQYFLSLLLVFSVISDFSNHYNDLYVLNSYSPAKPSVAHQSVVKNFHKGDVIFKHWGPKIYLQGIDSTTQFFELGSYKGKKISTLLNQMTEHPSGWVIWHKYNEGRLDPKFVAYANLYFKKYTGYGIDKTGEEIYYYNKKMLKPLELFQYQQNLPNANLSLKNSYSFVFDLTVNRQTSGTVFSLKGNSPFSVDCFVKDTTLIIKTSEKDSIFVTIPSDTKKQIIWQLNPKKNSLFLNGEKMMQVKIKIKPELVKFQINPQFNGNINNIRIYDFFLNDAQINAILKDKTISEDLTVNKKKFRTLFLWKKN